MINALKSDSPGEFFRLNKNLLAKQVPHLHGTGFDDDDDNYDVDNDNDYYHFDVDTDNDGDTVVMM